MENKNEIRRHYDKKYENAAVEFLQKSGCAIEIAAPHMRLPAEGVPVRRPEIPSQHDFEKVLTEPARACAKDCRSCRQTPRVPVEWDSGGSSFDPDFLKQPAKT